MTIVLAVIIAAALGLLLLNLFSTGEKKLEHLPEHLYAAGDPQFLRAMGSLLGPSVLDGNQVSPLYNGNQIFPSMLAAIRSAKH